jgi:hypothetical protein
VNSGAFKTESSYHSPIYGNGNGEDNVGTPYRPGMLLGKPIFYGSGGIYFEAIDQWIGSNSPPTEMIMAIMKDVKESMDANAKNDTPQSGQKYIKLYKMENRLRKKKEMGKVKVIRQHTDPTQYSTIILGSRLFYFYVLLLNAITFDGCRHTDVQSIMIEPGIRAEGKIVRDSTFDGQVRYFSTAGNRLLKQVNCSNGVVDGPCIEFYPNGRVSTRYYVSNRKLNGVVFIYDTTGNIVSENFYYYGLRVGEGKEYENKKLKSYSFYSLDNKLLFKIDYDSIKYKKISQLESKFFFFNESSYQTIEGSNFSEKKHEYFVYLPNPPNFEFQYSLVVIDSLYNVKREIMKFDNQSPWTVFEVPTLPKDEHSSIAFQLIVTDTNMVIGKAHLIKRIDVEN